MYLLLLIIQTTRHRTGRRAAADDDVRISTRTHLHNDTREKFRVVMQIAFRPLIQGRTKVTCKQKPRHEPASLSRRLSLSRSVDAAQQATLLRNIRYISLKESLLNVSREVIIVVIWTLHSKEESEYLLLKIISLLII